MLTVGSGARQVHVVVGRPHKLHFRPSGKPAPLCRWTLSARLPVPVRGWIVVGGRVTHFEHGPVFLFGGGLCKNPALVLTVQLFQQFRNHDKNG